MVQPKLLVRVCILLLTGCATPTPTPFTNGTKTYPPIGCIGTKYICLIDPIFDNLKDKWTFRSDSDLYSEPEHWATPQETEKNNLSGDCEDFAIYLRSELAKAGIKSRLVLVELNGAGHIVVITESGYILDSLEKFIVAKGELWNYEFISQSGFTDGEDWHKI